MFFCSLTIFNVTNCNFFLGGEKKANNLNDVEVVTTYKHDRKIAYVGVSVLLIFAIDSQTMLRYF